MSVIDEGGKMAFTQAGRHGGLPTDVMNDDVISDDVTSDDVMNDDVALSFSICEQPSHHSCCNYYSL